MSGAGNTAITITLTSSANPTEPAQPIVFTANATATGATPEGVVEFCDGSTVLGTVCLSGGQATWATSALGVGNHVIAAWYAGSAGFRGSTNTLCQTVRSPLRSAADQTAHVLMPVVLTNLVLNSTWLSHPLTFGLGAGAPVGACVGTDGVFCWAPSKAQARSTNVITSG